MVNDNIEINKNHTMNFSNKPVLVFWETTRACLLACKHCRASAIRTPLPGELTTEEGFELIDKISSFGVPPPVLILTGGDPLLRQDLFTLMEYAGKAGLKFAVSPAVTDKLTHEMLAKLKDCGTSSISISLDGAVRETHDNIRGVDGTFERTIAVVNDAVNLGLGVQINTTVMKKNIYELPEIFHLIKKLGVKTWEVFFLIKIGRGLEIEGITPEEYEGVCNFLYDASRYGLVLRTVEGPSVRRVAAMRFKYGEYFNGDAYKKLHSELIRLEGNPVSLSTIATRGTMDGDGIIFVGYDGAIQPSGLLPLCLGNIKTDDLSETYRNNKILKAIRNRELSGQCGACEYKIICGGSRSRAYSGGNGPTASDPLCNYSIR